MGLEANAKARSDALGAQPLFALPTGESVFVWFHENPVAVVVLVRMRRSSVTVSIANGERCAVLRGPEEASAGVHSAGEWARMRAIAYSVVALFEETGKKSAGDNMGGFLDPQRIRVRCDELRRLDGLTQAIQAMWSLQLH